MGSSLSQFPETHHTLIQRLVDNSHEDDWQQFLGDYWRPVCRFAARYGKLTIEDAEDIGSLTFMAILEGNLLEQWILTTQSKLRTFVCGVARNVVANRARIQSGREKILKENRKFLLELATFHSSSNPAEDNREKSLFYTVWVEELLQSSLNALQAELLASGKGDYFRVLYGRICENMSNPEIASSLNLKVTDVENFFKRSRDMLKNELQQSLADHVRRYCPNHSVADEVSAEWDRLGEYLKEHGGLEAAMKGSYELVDDLAVNEERLRTTFIKQLSIHSAE